MQGKSVRVKASIAALSLAVSACGIQSDQASPAPQAAATDMRAAASDPRLAAFYESRNWQPAWNVESARALIAAIGDAQRHALDRDTYLDPIKSARGVAAHDAALSLAALTYAEALARGRTDPSRIREIYTVARPEGDLSAGLTRAIASGEVRQWLAGLAPQDEEYRLLSEAYVQYNRQASAALSQPANARSAAPAATSEAIERARTLAINLERRRWLEREPAATRIDVNTGGATLAYVRDGVVADRRRVVVGEPGNETPQLGSPIYRLVANPTWTVPRSIQEREIGPRGDAYLARNNMEMRDGWIVQKSGPTNSLGLVKFDMRNEHAIYLHDTPAKALFGQDERHRSHGCVRVQDALGFARMIAEQEGVLPEWERALATGEETFVALPRQIPVRLLYHTAFVENGRVVFAPDAYGWDEDVAQALGLAARPRPAARPRSTDVGP
jgi:murein L,D-transpeptidase YcbB/YkuD